jgi:hypothetical protein
LKVIAVSIPIFVSAWIAYPIFFPATLSR